MGGTHFYIILMGEGREGVHGHVIVYTIFEFISTFSYICWLI